MEEVFINGVKYIPAKNVVANRDAIIRGLLKSFWGELGEEYNEDDKADGVYCFVTDDPNYSGSRTVQQVADDIAEYS